MTTSNNRAGRTATVTQNELSAIFHATRELTNLEESELSSIGWTDSDLHQLLAAVRNVRSRLKGSVSESNVTISATSASTPRSGQFTYHSYSKFASRVDIPDAIASTWHQAIQITLQEFQPMEIKMRTGYTVAEIQEAAKPLLVLT